MKKKKPRAPELQGVVIAIEISPSYTNLTVQLRTNHSISLDLNGAIRIIPSNDVIHFTQTQEAIR